jgi:hypothetical protein
MKQIGLAMHNYHDVFGQFALTMWESPWSNPGEVGGVNDWGNGSKGSWLVRLLPYIDQSALYNQMDFNLGSYNQFETQVVGGKRVSAKVIPAFVCPSDINGVTAGDGNYAKSNYAISAGNSNMNTQGDCGRNNLGNTFGLGVWHHAEGDRPSTFSGIGGRGPWAASIAQISDGTSNVIMSGEVNPECTDHQWAGWMHWNNNWSTTTAPINWPTHCQGRARVAESIPGCHDWNDHGFSQGFKSNHIGGVHVVMCDGAVKFLGNNIDWLTYQKLGDRRDGQTTGEY